MKFNSILYCLLLFAFTNAGTPAKAQAVNVTDSLALVDLYNSTNGPGWYNQDNWLTKKPISTWYGITVTGTRVTEIQLAGNQLSGSIPSSFGNLTALTELQFEGNQLSGSIPSSIGNLTALAGLFLEGNQLSGPIPTSIGNLAALTELFLTDNQLNGSIPSSIGNLAKLEQLWLGSNQLTGSIPSSVGNLSNLWRLVLSFNQLTGSIPQSISSIPNLSELILGYNQLSGEIPSLGSLKQLSKLNLRNNQLTGSIPASIGTLTNLKHLYLQHNMLSGDIPNSFIYLKAQQIDLSFNQLTQSKNSPFSRGNPYMDLNISHNNLTFNIEYIIQNHPLTIYSPQSTITINQHEKMLSVSAGGTLSNNTYTWFKKGFADSVVITGDSTFQPSQNGKYYARVTNSIATQLTLYTNIMKYTISTSQDEMNAVNTKTLNNHFTVYPNPAHSIIHITVNGMADVTITNAAGNSILTKSINNNGDINVSNLTAGTYYIQNKTTGKVQKIEVMH